MFIWYLLYNVTRQKDEVAKYKTRSRNRQGSLERCCQEIVFHDGLLTGRLEVTRRRQNIPIKII